MTLPCTVCGTIQQVRSDAEFIFCTVCGTRIALGTHSYRTETDMRQQVFCINCNLQVDATAAGSIFSCNKCGENVCNICAKLSESKHYCPKCYATIPVSIVTSKRPISFPQRGKISAQPSTGKPGKPAGKSKKGAKKKKRGPKRKKTKKR